MADHILAIDQGTTSTRAIVFDRAAARSSAWRSRNSARSIRSPAGSSTIRRTSGARSSPPAARRCARPASRPRDVAAIGITNQRETTLVWDRKTGKPIHDAIVWQDRRTAERCAALREAGAEPAATAASGLIIDPYFSGTKVAWLLDHVKGARAKAERGELCFGTIDSFLIWRLTGGRSHATDATNASRTLMFDIHKQAWSDQLLALLDVPRGDAAGGEGLRRRFRRHRQGGLRRRDPDPRRCRRPAGGDRRPRLLQAGHAEIDLRHRLLRPAQHRRRGGALGPPAAHHHRLSTRRQGDLCAGGVDLHRRRGGAVAARRAEDHQGCGRDIEARRQGRPGAGGLSGAGLRRPRRALLGRGGARGDLRHHPRHHRRRDRPRRAGGGLLPDARPDGRDAPRLAGRPRRAHW